MELTPYQTHASIALVGFGVSAGMAANVPLAAGCFGGLGALHLYLLVRLSLADWRYDRRAAKARTEANVRAMLEANDPDAPSAKGLVIPGDRKRAQPVTRPIEWGDQ